MVLAALESANRTPIYRFLTIGTASKECSAGLPGILFLFLWAQLISFTSISVNQFLKAVFLPAVWRRSADDDIGEEDLQVCGQSGPHGLQGDCPAK